MKRFSPLFIILISLIVSCTKIEPVEGFRFSLAETPPMGWNSWNKFGPDITEELIIEIADAMITSGMKDAGYEYVIIDDGWASERDEHGILQPDPEKFPNGIGYLADYVHSKGLKFGIYSSAGISTCLGHPGSLGYEEVDAQTFADWDVDYVKYDYCNPPKNANGRVFYRKFAQALVNTGKPIVLLIADGGMHEPWEWGKGIGHAWRVNYDLGKCWENAVDYPLTFVEIIDGINGLEKYSGKGHWNDPDMLQVGNGCLNHEENKSHFSFWCLLTAPLIAGNDIINMSEADRKILTNTDAIAVNQDTLGKQGYKVFDEGDFEIWEKPLSGRAYAFIMFNRSDHKISRDLNLLNSRLPDKTYIVRDLWLHRELGPLNSIDTLEIPPHGVRFIKAGPGDMASAGSKPIR